MEESTADLRMPTDGESCVGTGGTPGVVVEELDDPEFGTLDVNTGSSRSSVATDITGCTDHQHCMPVVGAEGGCGEAIGKFGVGRFKLLYRSKKSRSLIGTKDGRDDLTSEQRYAEREGMQIESVSGVDHT